MTATIQAKVNRRLLSKADRLFTGTMEGRIIEILQNARRAGATQVRITNRDGEVTVQDNGSGVERFETLLDLGGSDWSEETNLELSEDPAGVGLFCLAPRRLTIRSNGKLAVIEQEGWTGAPVPINDNPEPIRGTRLDFMDEPWNKQVVDPLAVFTGMNVTVDGAPCPCEPFIHDGSTHHQDLGARIEVTTVERLSLWHHQVARVGCVGRINVVVNFHGQTVGFNYWPIQERDLFYLVDLTGEPTSIRLMLPARTQLVENEAYAKLKHVLERESYLYVQRRGQHQLPYKQYLRARELGIALPEAEPVFQVGLLHSEPPEPVNVIMPKGMALAACYQPAESLNEADRANIHLLAAFGSTREPFIPVEIGRDYRPYSWARIPTIDRVEPHVGKTRHEDSVDRGELTCVERLSITAHTSDGGKFHSDVYMAVPAQEDGDWADSLLVTEDVRNQVAAEQIWHHLGGYCDDGDTYDTQAYDFDRALEAFWLTLDGPDETLRTKIMAPLCRIDSAWRAITVLSNGYVTIHFTNGQDKTMVPPQVKGGEA